jgi:phospholipid/cholesterol/gamma-HCH transport system substrate-binding protein
VIRSVHSEFDLFLSSLPELTARMNGLVDRSTRILSDKNIAGVERIVANLDKAAAQLPHSAGILAGLVDKLQATVDDAHQVIGEIHGATRTASVDFVAAVQKLRATSDNLERATGSLDALVAENRDQLSGFVRSDLPQIDSLLRDSRAAAQEIRDLSHSLRDNPSQLLYQPVAGGVVIPP